MLCYEKCLPGDDTDTIGELFGRNGLCAGTLITLRASEEAAALFTASAWQASEAVITTWKAITNLYELLFF